MQKQRSRGRNSKAISVDESWVKRTCCNGNNCHADWKYGRFQRWVNSVTMSGNCGYTNGSEKNYWESNSDACFQMDVANANLDGKWRSIQFWILQRKEILNLHRSPLAIVNWQSKNEQTGEAFSICLASFVKKFWPNRSNPEILMKRLWRRLRWVE